VELAEANERGEIFDSSRTADCNRCSEADATSGGEVSVSAAVEHWGISLVA